MHVNVVYQEIFLLTDVILLLVVIYFILFSCITSVRAQETSMISSLYFYSRSDPPALSFCCPSVITTDLAGLILGQLRNVGQYNTDQALPVERIAGVPVVSICHFMFLQHVAFSVISSLFFVPVAQRFFSWTDNRSSSIKSLSCGTGKKTRVATLITKIRFRSRMPYSLGAWPNA